MTCPIAHAINQLADRLKVIATETLPIDDCRGRILAEDLRADRDSPAADLSAMDGFAIRHADYKQGQSYPTAGESAAGKSPAKLPAGQAMKIFTGALLPAGADTVIQCELAEIQPDSTVRFTLPTEQCTLGRSVRYQGENTKAGETVLPAGTILNAAAMATLSSFGTAEVVVRKQVRISIINTGTELKRAGQPVQPWQIRDSNGPLLQAMFSSLGFCRIEAVNSVIDQPESLAAAILEALSTSDAILLTGGVSMGDYDFVPQVLADCGVEKIFHKLPMRPGRPIYAGVGEAGQLVCGLPGNPVSVAVTARRIIMPLIQFLAGCGEAVLSGQPLQIADRFEPSDLNLVFYRLAKVAADGSVELASNQGSGDVVSIGTSSGFIEFNPFVEASDSLFYYAW